MKWYEGFSSTALRDVCHERLRQESLLKAGKFLWTCASIEQSNARKLAVLAEEFGELSKEVTDEMIFLDKLERDPCEADHIKCAFRMRMREELVQTAAVAVAWIEALDQLDDLVSDAGHDHT